jgi:hypothetical protein
MLIGMTVQGEPKRRRRRAGVGRFKESWSVFLMRCGTDTRGKENGVRVLQCMGIGPKNCKT